MIKEKSAPTKEEINSLVSVAKEGDDLAKEALFEQYKELLHSLSYRYAAAGDKDDVFQVACEAFCVAITRFNPDNGAKASFMTYLRTCVFGEIQNYYRDNKPIRVPAHIQEQARKVRKLELEKASSTTVANQLDLTKEGANKVLQYLSLEVKHLENSRDGQNTPKRNEFYYDHLEGDLNIKWVDNIILRDAMQILTPREHRIIQMIFFEDCLLKEVVAEIGVSMPRIRLFRDRALGKLKLALNSI
ncbi:putative RNA polymerase sigma factor SigF 1 [Bacillus phage phiAGATE]|uniref:RNA polymerase sigma factor SigF 1 n=1 Tax=Bacillus phage phiAGATE TaxID=1204533 RepID=L0L8G8_9CAUD|nr:RNA polymerase sigma factor [Bacillus phage phiAGATE]AGB62714.1 putative RNA polymerase sigma factor SigF 1 [Bacillus phage phiAGATE]